MKLGKIAVIGIVLGVFYMAIQPAMDLDLGWHLRYGQYFFQTGQVLKDNILSFVWPDYKWVQASWGFDVLLYLTYQFGGLMGVSIAGAVITTLVFILATNPYKKNLLLVLFLAIIFLAIGSPLYASGMRSQTPSTVFFLLVILIADSYIKNEGGWKKLVYGLPVIFWVWANMHGGFSLGLLLLLGMWLVAGGLKILSIKRWLTFGGLLVLSVLLPLINPFGTRIYEETFKHSTNQNLTVIVEWMPLTSWRLEAGITGGLCAIALVVLILRKQKNNIPVFMALVLITYLAFSALRFLINLAVLLVYFLAINLPELKYKFLEKKWWKLGISIILVGIILGDVFTYRIYFNPQNMAKFPTTWDSLCKLSFDCDEDLATVMNSNLPKGNGYNPYNLGGYLSWRVLGVKTFVDGRMAAWEDDIGKTPPVIEGDWVYMQKNPVTFRKFDSQYHFTWVVVPTETFIADYLKDLARSGSWELKYRGSLYSYYVKK